MSENGDSIIDPLSLPLSKGENFYVKLPLGKGEEIGALLRLALLQ